MTRAQILADLYARLLSRKLWMALLAIAFAAWNYHLGLLAPTEFQAAVTTAVLGYLAAEGAADALAAFRPKDAPDAVVTTTVDAAPKVADPPKRTRPSRAKGAKK